MSQVAQKLTIAEIDAGSRMIKADMITALTSDSPAKASALAAAAWLLARRTDRAAQLATYRAMTIDELSAELGVVDDDTDPAELTVTPEQLAAAAGQLGIGFDQLADALALDVPPPADPATDDPATDDPASSPEVEQLEADPTDPAPAP